MKEINDLISRTSAIECAIDAVDDWDGGWNPNRETVIRKYFEEVPAVDAVPVRHGRWMKPERSLWPMADCSVCGEMCIVANTSNYCPHCGALMDLEE